MEIVKKRRRSHELDERVYSRLGETTQLKVLDLGYESRPGFEALRLITGHVVIMQINGRLYTDISPAIRNSLELTMASGMCRLGTLKGQKLFGFESVRHRIGTKELAWMAASWPRLRSMRGFQELLLNLKYDDNVKVQILKDYGKIASKCKA